MEGIQQDKPLSRKWIGYWPRVVARWTPTYCREWEGEERVLGAVGAGYALGQGRQLLRFWVKYDAELLVLCIMVHIPALGASDLHIPAWAGDWPVPTLRGVFRRGQLGLSGAAKSCPAGMG